VFDGVSTSAMSSTSSSSSKRKLESSSSRNLENIFDEDSAATAATAKAAEAATSANAYAEERSYLLSIITDQLSAVVVKFDELNANMESLANDAKEIGSVAHAWKGSFELEGGRIDERKR
jgi:outer membrane murein-binding lipoprotein Lpp